MSTEGALLPRLYFSYSQFMVFDSSERQPGCMWTAAHAAQGFARRESVLAVLTLLEWGHADLRLHRGAYRPDASYERAIAVPFLVTSGRVLLEGIEEYPGSRGIDLPSGVYRLAVAQRATGPAEEAIELFFEFLTRPLERSVILVADKALSPATPLLETADVAGRG